MRKILRERLYALSLKDTNDQVKYLERLATELNNSIVDELKESDRVKYVNSLVDVIKLISEIETGEFVKQIQERLEKLEVQHAQKTTSSTI